MTVASLTAALPSWRDLRADTAWCLLALAFAVVLALAPGQAWDSVLFTGASLVEISPFLIASIGIAAYAKASRADGLIAKAFQGRMLPMVALAAFAGAFSPFCSCGVIPLIAALLAMGVPLAPVMAFWLASPLMDPSMFVLTLATLGLDFAAYKAAAAFGIGLFGGLGTWALTANGVFANFLRPEVGDGGCGGSAVRDPRPVRWKFWKEDGRMAVFAKDARHNTVFLGKWLTLAFFLESLMVAYLPPDLVASAVGGDGWQPIAIATLVGIPAYLNGYAALPLVAGLISQGMNPGAGMTFLLAGGVTCIPAAIAVWALVRPPVFFAYIGFALVGAFTAGMVFSSLA